MWIVDLQNNTADQPPFSFLLHTKNY